MTSSHHAIVKQNDGAKLWSDLDQRSKQKTELLTMMQSNA